MHISFRWAFAAIIGLVLSSCSKTVETVDPGPTKALKTGSTYTYYFTTKNIFGEIVTRDTLTRTIGRTGLTIDGKAGATEIIQSMAGMLDTSYIATETNGDLSVWISTIDENISYPHWITYPTVSKSPYHYTVAVTEGSLVLSGEENTSFVSTGSATIGGTTYDYSRVSFMGNTELNDQGTIVTGNFDMTVDYSPTLLLPVAENGGNFLAPALLQYAKGTATFVRADIK